MTVYMVSGIQTSQEDMVGRTCELAIFQYVSLI